MAVIENNNNSNSESNSAAVTTSAPDSVDTASKTNTDDNTDASNNTNANLDANTNTTADTNADPATAGMDPETAAAYAAYMAKVAAHVPVTNIDVASLLESELQTATGTVATTDALARKKIIGLYFSAHWCPPCRKLTPVLAQVYDDIKEQDGLEDELEIVYVSYDKTPEEFAEYFADMPWLALPYAKRELKKSIGATLGVFGIPMLFFIDASSGAVLTQDGHEVIEKHAADTDALLAALRK